MLSRSLIARLIAFAVWLCAGTASAQTPPLPAPERFHLFLLVGQSNMAGRGVVTAEDKAAHPRVVMLNKAGEWVPAVDPIHFDADSYRELGRRFARAYLATAAETPPRSDPMKASFVSRADVE